MTIASAMVAFPEATGPSFRVQLRSCNNKARLQSTRISTPDWVNLQLTRESTLENFFLEDSEVDTLMSLDAAKSDVTISLREDLHDRIEYFGSV